jgi:beta-galactosidase beta subunit
LQLWIEWEDIINYTKIQTVKFWQYFNRMEDIQLVKKITNWNLIGMRNNGHQSLYGETK